MTAGGCTVTEPVAYYLWGEESYRIDREIKAVVDRMRDTYGEEPELLLVDDELSPQQLLETLEYSPLFAMQRVVVLKRPAFLDKAGRKAARARDYEKVLDSYFRQAQEGQVLIITSHEKAGTNPIVKMLEKQARVIACPRWAAQDIRTWVEAELAARGRQANPQLMDRLAQSGQDQYYLVNLIDKLCLMVPQGIIPVSALEDQIEVRSEIKIFSLIDGITARQSARALNAYHRLRQQGEDPIGILAMINRQMQTLVAVKNYHDKGFSKASIVEVTGQKEYTVRKMTEVSRNFSWNGLERIFSLLLDTDVGLKSSSTDSDMLMEMLLVDICSKKDH